MNSTFQITLTTATNQHFSLHIVSAWILIPLANHNPAIFSVPPGTEKLSKYPPSSRHVFNNNTYVDFRIDYKHITIPSYAIQII